MLQPERVRKFPAVTERPNVTHRASARNFSRSSPSATESMESRIVHVQGSLRSNGTVEAQADSLLWTNVEFRVQGYADTMYERLRDLLERAPAELRK